MENAAGKVGACEICLAESGIGEVGIADYAVLEWDALEGQIGKVGRIYQTILKAQTQKELFAFPEINADELGVFKFEILQSAAVELYET